MEKTLIDCKSIASIEPSEKTPDLLSIKFIMCHEMENDNKDVWLRDVLSVATPTIKHKYIDWDHVQPILGTVVDSEMILDERVNKYGVKASGFLWKFLYPNLCDVVLENYKTGKLKMSFEAYFPDCFFVASLEDLDDPSKRISRQEFESRGYRLGQWYRVFAPGTFFGAVGIVSNPADQDAWILEVASNRNPIKDYHTKLHFIYENELFDILPEEVVIAEHRRLHESYGNYIG